MLHCHDILLPVIHPTIGPVDTTLNVSLRRHTASLARAAARRVDPPGELLHGRHRRHEPLHALPLVVIQTTIIQTEHLVRVLTVAVGAGVAQRIERVVLALGGQTAVDHVAEGAGRRAVVGARRGVAAAAEVGRRGVGADGHGRGVARLRRRAAGLDGVDGGGWGGFEVALEGERSGARVERLGDAHAVVPAEGLLFRGVAVWEEGLLAVVWEEDVVYV